MPMPAGPHATAKAATSNVRKPHAKLESTSSPLTNTFFGKQNVSLCAKIKSAIPHYVFHLIPCMVGQLALDRSSSGAVRPLPQTNTFGLVLRTENQHRPSATPGSSAAAIQVYRPGLATTHSGRSPMPTQPRSAAATGCIASAVYAVKESTAGQNVCDHIPTLRAASVVRRNNKRLTGAEHSTTHFRTTRLPPPEIDAGAFLTPQKTHTTKHQDN